MECCDFPPLGLPQWFPRFCTTPSFPPIVVQKRGNHPRKGGGVVSVYFILLKYYESTSFTLIY